MKMLKLKNLPIGSKWTIPHLKLKGVLLEVYAGSADVIILNTNKDWEGDNTMPLGRLRISKDTEVKWVK